MVNNKNFTLTVVLTLAAAMFSNNLTTDTSSPTGQQIQLLGRESPTTQKIGMNLPTHRRYETQIPFVDVFKQTGGYAGGSSWQTDDAITYDSNNYPIEIVPPDEAFTLFGGNPYAAYPGGTYTLIMEGSGTLELGYDASGTFDQDGGEHSYQVNVDPTNLGLKFKITRSNINDNLRNIRFIMPGHENTYLTQPFYPLFLDRLRPFSPIRLMQWQRINDAQITSWEERTKLSYSTQTTDHGPAYEYGIWMANAIDSDIWWSVPVRGDDDFIMNLAQLTLDNLDQELKVYLEYSNELWRPTDQRTYAVEQGLALWPGIANNDAARRWTAKRSAEIFEIFNDVFGRESNRIVKIIPVWSGQTSYSDDILDAFAQTDIDGVPVNPNEIDPDAITGAPYFGRHVFDEIMQAGTQDTITVPEIIGMLGGSHLDHGIQRMTNDKDLLDEYNALHGWNMELLAYEGGQALMATPPANYPPLEEKLKEANRHPGMYNIYEQYFDAWKGLTDSPFVYFNFVKKYINNDPFGALEHLDQNPEKVPKYKFLIDRAEK